MRKPGSVVRDRLNKILSVVNKIYGYEAQKIYEKVYGDVLLRTLYYNLKKGVEEGIFEIVDVAEIPGDFTWGFESNRVYYQNRKNVQMNQEEKKKIRKAAENVKKSMQQEVKKWVSKTSEQMKKKDLDPLERIRLLKKCRKIKSFYKTNFGKYPKKLDEWIRALTP